MSTPELSGRLPKLWVEDGIGRITLQDPVTYNALSPAAFARLGEIFSEVRERAHRDVHALILTGNGKGFCAGAELGSMFQKRSPQSTEGVGERIDRWTREEGTPVVKAWADLPVPMVTAVNGVTAGIGLSLALSGDIVIAARSASFAVPFLTVLGIVPDGGTSWILPRLIGPARTRATALLGEKIGAEQAAEWGLIWQCVDDRDLDSEALSIARKLSGLPRYACRELRGLLAESSRRSFSEQYDAELARNAELLNGAEFREGLQAFQDKRRPQFKAL